MSITCYDSNDAVISQLYQWDIDRRIRLVGDELTGVTEVHMTNKGQRNAVRVEYASARTGIVVTVPNFLLRKADPLVIYLYQEMGGTEERTVYELQIPIAKRAMPVGYVDSEAWSGSDRVFDTIDLDDYLLAQEDSLRGKITVLKVLELAGVDALADRVSTIEGKETGWNAKWGSGTIGQIPITALEPTAQILIMRGSQAGADAASALAGLENKVDKVTGKELSTNDYDSAAKAKVDAIPANPQYTDTTYTAGTGISISDQNVISATGGGGSADAVLYTEQSLTSAQQAQARTNIDADQKPLIGQATDSAATGYLTPAQVKTALQAGREVIISKEYVDPETQAAVGTMTFNSWAMVDDNVGIAVISNTVLHYQGVAYTYSLIGEGSTWTFTMLSVSLSPDASNATPQALGTAAAGSSLDYAREDHVHKMPTAADTGAIAAPSSPATGAFLVWNGTAWTAQTLATWQGGNY